MAFFLWILFTGYATKLCDASGQWFVNSENREWTNYSMCARDDVSLLCLGREGGKNILQRL